MVHPQNRAAIHWSWTATLWDRPNIGIGSPRTNCIIRFNSAARVVVVQSPFGILRIANTVGMHCHCEMSVVPKDNTYRVPNLCTYERPKHSEMLPLWWPRF